MIACCFTVATRTGTPLATCSSVPPLPLWTPSPRPDVRDALERVAPRSTSSATNSKRFALETRSAVIVIFFFFYSSSSSSFSFQSTNQRRKKSFTATRTDRYETATTSNQHFITLSLSLNSSFYFAKNKTKQNSAATGWNRDCVCNNNNSLPSSSS